MGRWANSINLCLITHLAKKRKDPSFRARVRRGEGPDGSPIQREIFLGYLAAAWGKLTVASGLCAIVFGSFLDRVAGSAGQHVGLALFLFVSVFCLTGFVDAGWRIQLVGIARRRYERSGSPDRLGQRLMTISTVNDWTLLLQLVAGLVAAVVF